MSRRVDEALKRRDNRVRAEVYRTEAAALYKLVAEHVTKKELADVFVTMARMFEKAAEKYEARG